MKKRRQELEIRQSERRIDEAPGFYRMESSRDRKITGSMGNLKIIF